jgi:hypothetical protein
MGKRLNEDMKNFSLPLQMKLLLPYALAYRWRSIPHTPYSDNIVILNVPAVLTQKNI